MTSSRRFAWVAAVVLLALFAASCGSKDLVSVAKLAKGDISVRDRFGNQVTVPNPDEFRKAIKSAKKVADPKDSGATTKADYVILNDAGMVSYDWEGKYLVYTGAGSKRQVYQGDLTTLLSGLNGLPPRIGTGKGLDAALSPSFEALSKTTGPWAAAFSSQGKQLLMITAGEVPSAGYSLELERAELSQDGSLALTARLTPPSGPAATVISYPYIELTIEGNRDVDVRLLSSGASGEKVEHVTFSKIDAGQTVLPVRPERGSLVLEYLTVAGFVKAPDSGGVPVEVAVADGYNVLGKKTVTAGGTGEWLYFETGLDIAVPTNPYGSVMYRATVDGEYVEITVPVSFSGK